MRNIFLIFTTLLLFSCSPIIYKETWVVEKTPVSWEEEFIIPGDHFHFEDDNCNWKCYYSESDTVCLYIEDTIEVRRLESVIKIKHGL